MELRRGAWVYLLVVGCGRIGFDPTSSGGDGGAGDDGGGDASVPRPCPIGSTAPDPLTITGKALRVNFVGGITPEASVTVSVLDQLAGTTLGSDTTDVGGNFSIPVPTGGVPLMPFMTFEKSGLLTSVYVPDEATDVDLSVPGGYMGSDLAVGSLYAAGGVSRDPGLGTVFVVVSDCAGNAVSGATVSLDPAPEKIIYGSVLGIPNVAATETSSSGFAWALNAPVGPATLSGAMPGATFVPHAIDIQGPGYFMGSTLRPVP